jgi:O-antigen biosynthesis protein
MPRAKPPIASIVILCHNDGVFLKGCLESVYTHTDVPFEVILVDNDTQDGFDGYLDKVARRRSNARVIHNEQNRFFAGGNNQGLSIAKGKYLVLLNADAVVGPGWLSALIACAERAPEIGLVAPVTNGAMGPQLVREPGYASIKEFPAFARRWAKAHAGRFEAVHRLIAFCLLIKRSTLDRVGLLDERFGPGGYEDYDYCLRAQQAGLQCVMARDVFVHHFGGKGYAGMDYSYHRRVNREVLARKWSQFIFHALDEMDGLTADAAAAGRPAAARR